MPKEEVMCEGPAGGEAFLADLVTCLNAAGVECALPPVVYQQAEASVLDHLKLGCDAAQQHFKAPCELLLVLLRNHNQALYQEVKLASDVELGIPSQCFLATKAGVGRQDQKGGQMQYCANLALKMNAKLGGKNVKFLLSNDMVVPALRSRPSFMVMGADVTHPTGAGRAAGEPSVTAITASHDPDLAQWASRVLLQEGGQEVIINLVDTVKELLMSYYEANGRKPEAIIYYRDGVAEGQFAQVLRHEYSAIREACFAMEASGNYCPPITFVVVQKRHNTRFFPAPGDNSNRDKTGNCLPGTVVDRDICHPTQFDFFLNSHAGLKGHNKPSHYHVLVDENGFTADGLQLFTYWQCYLYCRCTRSVSYVPAAYYAHLAAARGKLYIEDSDDASSSAASTTGTGLSSSSSRIVLRSVHPELQKRGMYYV